MNKVKHLGVLTGGGDCPGLNAVIRALVKTAEKNYGMKVTGILDGFNGLINNKTISLTKDIVAGILPRGGTILGTTNRDNPFKYGVKDKEGKIIFEDRSETVINNISKLGIDCLVVIGGDGSLSIANDLFKKGLPVVGVPKTIDNDLSATDLTFGFETAVSTATEALDRLHTTAESHHRVMILEVMGRYAGWIALYSGLAGGADIILIPEIPFTLRGIVKKVKERIDTGRKFSIVVVAEGATEHNGEMIVKELVEESFEPKRLGGIGEFIQKSLQEKYGFETRVTVLGHLQRGGTPIPSDRILATRYGVAAVQAAAQGKFGKMVCLRSPEIFTVDLAKAVGELKKVPADGAFVSAAKAIGISFGEEGV